MAFTRNTKALLLRELRSSVEFQIKADKASNFYPTRNGKPAFIQVPWVYESAGGQNRPKETNPPGIQFDSS